MLSRLFVYMAVRACIYSNMCLLLWQIVLVYMVICVCFYGGLCLYI